jgi:hypothetical protein
MEQHVAAEKTEDLGAPEHKNGWMDAHLRVPNGYPLVSVRYSRRDSSGRHAADWSEDAILPISGYAAVLVRAIAAEGTMPQRILVEAVADPSWLGSDVPVELQVWADGSGLDEVSLQRIATAALHARQASGKLGLAGQTTVVAKLVASAEAAPQASIAQQTSVAQQTLRHLPGRLPGRGRRAPNRPGMAAIVILLVGLATWRVAPSDLPAVTGWLPAAQIAAAPPEPEMARVGAVETAGEASAGAPSPDISAPSVAVDAATLVPTTGGEAAANLADRPPPSSIPAAPVPVQAQPNSAPRVLIDYSPQGAVRPDWPNDQRSTAWFGPDGYHLVARQPGRFVAVGLLADQHLRDVLLTATFHKAGGPTGGGYGLILRDQGPGPRDGLNQLGRFLVVEVDDRGKIGMWRRDNDRWIDLLPWTASASVHPLNAENVIAFKVAGDQLTLSVNGSEVATSIDATLQDGGAGVFVGGDDNQAVLTQLRLQAID